MMTVEVKVMMETMTKMITLVTMIQQSQYGEESSEIDVMTQSRLMSESLYWSVIKNLTLHRVKKIIFSLYHHKKQIRSFPTMYNTWGCSWGQIGEIIFFLQKSGLKTPILADTVLDHPTSKWAGTHNFKDIANFHRCFKKSGT